VANSASDIPRMAAEVAAGRVDRGGRLRVMGSSYSTRETRLDDRKLADSAPIERLRQSHAGRTSFALALGIAESPRLAHDCAENGGHPANVGRHLDINLYRWTRYPRSRVMAIDKMALSRWMMALRLRKWKKFYGIDSRVAASITGLDKIPGGLAFQYAIFLVFKIW